MPWLVGCEGKEAFAIEDDPELVAYYVALGCVVVQEVGLSVEEVGRRNEEVSNELRRLKPPQRPMRDRDRDLEKIAEASNQQR